MVAIKSLVEGTPRGWPATVWKGSVMAALVDSPVGERMRIPAGVVTRSLVVVRPVDGHVSVHDARTDLAVVAVQWGDVYIRFTSAAQVSAMLAAFGAVRAAMRGVDGAVPDGSVHGPVWPWVSVLSVTWKRPPDWSVVSQSRFDQHQRRKVYWVDVHMGPVLWRVVDWTGYESALALLRNVHRTAVAVFADGGKFRTDPSKVDAFVETAGV